MRNAIFSFVLASSTLAGQAFAQAPQAATSDSDKPVASSAAPAEVTSTAQAPVTSATTITSATSSPATTSSETLAGPTTRPVETPAPIASTSETRATVAAEPATAPVVTKRLGEPEGGYDEDIFILDTMDTVWVISDPEERARVVGSAHALSEEDLEEFEHNDIQRVLKEVPGVYVRGEDGYGLRPNIGLRGANSDRSSKVTLMEDGILLAPAPYAAPAAYYFPLTTRLSGVEVYKGPAATRYGPNTIGGAVNLQTRKIPSLNQGYLDVAGGRDRFGKVHGWWGTSGKHWGILLEGAHLQTEGFKELDGAGPRGNTGFDKNEAMIKARVNTDPADKHYHRLELKLGYADEAAHETYLGLSRDDFEENPMRRYAASQDDFMVWNRELYELTHFYSIGESFDIRTTGYRHDFTRDWTKLSGFRDGPDLKVLLANPQAGQNAVFTAILKGQEDSQDENQALLLGSNDRTYVSQGISSSAHVLLPDVGPVTQKLETGARFHYDRIERFHTEEAFLMRSGTLVPEESPVATTTRNRGQAQAWAFYLQDQISWGDLLVVPGGRVELIRTEFTDFLGDEVTTNRDSVFLPGIGTYYEIVDWLGVLGGVHRGFSPVAPGQPDEVKPELSTNYEAGARLKTEKTSAELIGYLNDYDNLTGACTLSSGCTDQQLHLQFNGGAVNVYGVESVFSQRFDLPAQFELRGDVTYTLTMSSFETSFQSSSPQFGDVEQGDELPYVPKHRGTLVAALSRLGWSGNLSVSYIGAMRDTPGQGEIPEEEKIEAHTVVDVASTYAVTDRASIYATVNNVLNAAYTTSYRPYGLRPGAPIQYLAGFKYRFGEE